MLFWSADNFEREEEFAQATSTQHKTSSGNGFIGNPGAQG